MIYINVQKYSLSTSKRCLQGKGLSLESGKEQEKLERSRSHSPDPIRVGRIQPPTLAVSSTASRPPQRWACPAAATSLDLGYIFQPFKKSPIFVFYIQQFLMKSLPKKKSSVFYHCSSTSNMFSYSGYFLGLFLLPLVLSNLIMIYLSVYECVYLAELLRSVKV